MTGERIPVPGVVRRIHVPQTLVPVLSSWDVSDGERAKTGRPRKTGAFEWRGKVRR